jgi:hypothetical protein
LGQANRRGEMARLARERIARLHLSNDEVIQSILYADDATIAIAQPGWGCKVTENGG